MANLDKGLYDKKIVYLDYLERGEKVKNGGFIKWEVRGDTSRVQIQVRGLYPTDTLQGEIVILSEGNLHTADHMQLRYGTGEYAAIWKKEDLAGTGVSFTDCDGILIRLSENRLLRGQWRESLRKQDRKTVEPQAEEDFVLITEETSQEAQTAETESVLQTKVQEPTQKTEQNPEQLIELEAAAAEPSEMGQNRMVDTVQKAVREKTEAVQEEVKPESDWKMHGKCRPPIAGDKWEQLNREYPKIHPFGDAREYLSITPRDFIVLSREHHSLVQNSFLLHGYYNYGHVILTRIKNKEEETFYLGVPGVYFDREKQAALLFGFEGFESGNEQITDGGFGYYMKRVEI